MFRIIAALLLCNFGFPAAAATFSPDTTNGCMARMEGTIERGDFERFQSFAQQHLKPSNHEEGTGDVVLCLNSPGGSLGEAVKIADYLEQNYVGTAVGDGDKCLSACAVVFMMGTRALIEDFTINRSLHVNGTLGFHRPQFSLPSGGSYSAEVVNRSFQLALEATLQFVQLANRMQNYVAVPMVEADLMEAMFAHEGEDFFYIDTVGKAGRWKIDVTGFPVPTEVSPREALIACDNLSEWLTQVPGADLSIATDRDGINYLKSAVARVRVRADDPGDTYFVIGRVDGMGDRECRVQFDVSPSGLEWGVVQACGGTLHETRAIGEHCDIDITGRDVSFANMSANPAIAMFPPDTPLRTLPSYAAQVAAEAPDINARFDMPIYGGCGVSEGQGMVVTRVDNFANIRDAADFSARVVAEAPRNTRLWSLERGGRLVGSDATRARCRTACQALGRYWDYDDKAQYRRDREAVSQCFEDNAIWYRVEDAAGKQGYVSAKFLNHPWDGHNP
ncbi:hypothetical protein ACS3QZ_00695 [Shimia sp. W99]